MNEREVTLADKIESLKRAAMYRPLSTAGIVVFSFAAALLEGIGLTFLVPVIEIAQAGPQAAQDADGIVGMFAQTYAFLGLPFTVEWMLLGLGVVMTVRYGSSFAVKWLRAKIRYEYMRDLRTRAFDYALAAQVSYYDREGSDNLINAIITQTKNGGIVLKQIISFFEQLLLSVMYLGIALSLAPVLTVIAAVSLGGITFPIRYVIEPGYTVGDRIASANERIQSSIQTGTQGIRDIKLFGMTKEVFNDFQAAIDTYTNSRIGLARNSAAINSFYELTVAFILFVMIYAALTILDLSFAVLGVFLFAMFRLAPRVSNLNSKFYNIEADLPHLVRTHWFIGDLKENTEEAEAGCEVPNTIETVRFENVSFSYETADEQVLRNISFEFERGEFVGFVGQSGAGKSTIVSLLVQMYEPNEGQITAEGTPIHNFVLNEWRDKIAMVRQKPFIFNETLRFNLTIGKRSASQAEIERIADITKITEFLDELPDGYDSVLGDKGVQLSGGQRQRVALARALLTDAEILVLDEATSDLDSNLEQQIHTAIEELENEYTILAIAHHLSTVKNADRIYTIESGAITESGTHNELVETGGKYAELYAIQS